MKKLQLASLTLAALLLAGCGASAASTAESTSEAVSTEETAPAATAAPAPAVTKAQAPAAALPDGVYTAKFNTDSSMFHANEAVDGMGTLTVENGTMTFHVSLQSQKIVNLYPGMAADAISAARPGARRENLENYIKRLEKLEEITSSFPGVEKSFAIQAGREVRVMVKPEQVSEDQMVILARELAKRIENELEYPGQIKVHVLRETKVVEYAK